MSHRIPGPPSSSPPFDESTAKLLHLVRTGDAKARDRLVRRFQPILQRWAAGRVPQRLHGVLDTDDLVQVTLIKALERVDKFESRHEGAFLGYLRTILINKLRDQARRQARLPDQEALDEQVAGREPSPLEEVIGAEALERYERALAKLPEAKRNALILRIEFGYSYEGIAEAQGSPSVDAARMQVTRALLELSKVLHEA